MLITSQIDSLTCTTGISHRVPQPQYHPHPTTCPFTFCHSESESCSVASDSLRPHGLYNPWNSPGQNTGVCSLSLLHRIFPIQRLYPGLLHCRQILYQLSHKGNPRVLEWVAYPFSSGSSWPGNRNGVSCIAGRFLTNWDIREAPRRGKIPSIIHRGQWPNEDHRQQRKGPASC